MAEEAQDFRFLDPACMVYSHRTDFVRNALPTALRLSNPKRRKKYVLNPKTSPKEDLSWRGIEQESSNENYRLCVKNIHGKRLLKIFNHLNNV